MKHAIDAVFENGAFRPIGPDLIPIGEGQRVRITIDDAAEPLPLRLARDVYDGLSADEIQEVERIALDRIAFFRSGPAIQ